MVYPKITYWTIIGKNFSALGQDMGMSRARAQGTQSRRFNLDIMSKNYIEYCVFPVPTPDGIGVL